jgi:hypothetical protein
VSKKPFKIFKPEDIRPGDKVVVCQVLQREREVVKVDQETGYLCYVECELNYGDRVVTWTPITNCTKERGDAQVL